MRVEAKNIKENPVVLLRRLGYFFQRNERDEMSFIRSLARAGFPRFHLYARVVGSDLVINVHLDQKKETYGDATRHHGEYKNEGPLKKETERIKSLLG